MYAYSILALFLTVTCYFKVTSSVCPPVNEIAPYCTCDESDFLCESQNKPNEPWDIVTYFDKVSTLIPEDTVYERFHLGFTDLKEIPAGAFKKIKFINITIYLNDKLEVIHPDAFGETLETTTKISIDVNYALTNEGLGDPSYDLFSVIRKFKNLEKLYITSNKIQSLPDSAFGSLPNLWNIMFSFSDDPAAVNKIGSKPFAGLPKLEILRLDSASSLSPPIEISEDAFQGLAKDVEVDFHIFKLVKFPEKTFRPLLDTASKVDISPYASEVDCGEESAWICKDMPKYRDKIRGFTCLSGSEFKDIFDYCEKTFNKN